MKLLNEKSDKGIALVDAHFEAKTLDLEVGMLAVLPLDSESQHRGFKPIREVPEGRVFEATAPGVGQVVSVARSWGAFVRITRQRYVGLAAYRHLEADDE